MRRQPLQARSKERVERILDAAERLFAEVGYEATTTEAVAERAETSIGGLYQFFPNKKALFDALADRHHQNIRVALDGILALDLTQIPWPKLLDKTVDILWSFSFSTPGFVAIWVQGNFSRELLAAGEALNRDLASRAEEVLKHYAPKLKAKQRALVATVMVETVSSMLFLAGRQESLRQPLRQETKKLLERYLAPYV